MAEDIPSWKERELPLAEQVAILRHNLRNHEAVVSGLVDLHKSQEDRVKKLEETATASSDTLHSLSNYLRGDPAIREDEGVLHTIVSKLDMIGVTLDKTDNRLSRHLLEHKTAYGVIGAAATVIAFVATVLLHFVGGGH